LKTFFITGTDTDVGKTVVTAIIAQLCHELGLSVGVIKPFQTGTDDYPTDLESIQKIINFTLFPIHKTLHYQLHFL
jgi:dethiobiotin synthetase